MFTSPASIGCTTLVIRCRVQLRASPVVARADASSSGETSRRSRGLPWADSTASRIATPRTEAPSRPSVAPSRTTAASVPRRMIPSLAGAQSFSEPEATARSQA